MFLGTTWLRLFLKKVPSLQSLIMNNIVITAPATRLPQETLPPPQANPDEKDTDMVVDTTSIVQKSLNK
jgi:hypothetical protein